MFENILYSLRQNDDDRSMLTEYRFLTQIDSQNITHMICRFDLNFYYTKLPSNILNFFRR